MKAIFAGLHEAPILVVGDHESIHQHGGCVRFWRDGEQLAFHVNLEALKMCRLQASPRFLQLSRAPGTKR